MLPLMYPGQAYHYNFQHNRDIYPDYEDSLYRVYFANSPVLYPWLQLKDNERYSPEVSADIGAELDVPILVSNVPGGVSALMYLKIMVSH